MDILCCNAEPYDWKQKQKPIIKSVPHVASTKKRRSALGGTHISCILSSGKRIKCERATFTLWEKRIYHCLKMIIMEWPVDTLSRNCLFWFSQYSHTVIAFSSCFIPFSLLAIWCCHCSANRRHLACQYAPASLSSYVCNLSTNN